MSLIYLIIFLTIALFVSVIECCCLYEVNKKYRKALEDIASAEYDMNKLVSIAIRALH